MYNFITITSLIILFSLCVFAGITQGSLWPTMQYLFSSPWGLATLVDLYIGLMIFLSFIAYIEKSTLRTILWFVGLTCLGNMTALVYLIVRKKQICSRLCRN